MSELVNRVANSGLKTINLEEFYPSEPFVEFDLKDFLFMELILKEKEFRQALKEFDWAALENKIVLVICSADAIIPVWAYMLVASYASPVAAAVFGGNKQEFLKHHFRKAVEGIDAAQYAEERVVIKGCSEKEVPPSAYLDIQSKLTGIAQSIMYGEPCSTVPIYKQPRKL